MACNSSDTPQGNNHDYCIANAHGPLCESCEEDNTYLNSVDGRCISCPNISKQVIVCCIIILLGATIVISVYIAVTCSRWKTCVVPITIVISALSLQAKTKIIISFLQVIASIGPVYGVKVHKGFISFLAFSRL